MSASSLSPFCNTSDAQHHAQNGMVLLIVLFWLAFLQVAALSSLSHSTLQIRSLRAYYEALHARHAAHAGNMLCTQWFEAGLVKARPWGESTPPAYWRSPTAFEGPFPAAFPLAQSWPLAARPPQCLVESWSPAGYPNPSFYLITVKGFGLVEQVQAWEQTVRWMETEPGDKEKWKRAQRPIFPSYTQRL